MASASPIRILTVDDHPLIRAGVAAFLKTEPDIEVIAEAADGEEGTKRCRDLRPDIVLRTYGGDEDIHRALEAGARGYLVKDMLVDEVMDVVRAVHPGRRGIPHAVAAKLAAHTPRIPLTPRETEALSLVAKGLSNAEVAGRIGRTEGTVKVHLKNILTEARRR